MLDEIYQKLDPVAFSAGPFVVTWYGLGYVVGFVLGAVLGRHLVKRWKIELSWDAILTALIACMLGAVLGARIGYVLIYHPAYYFSNPAQIIAFPWSGMSFHGGMTGLAIGLVVASRMLKVPLLTLGDLASICCTIGLGLVRVANFINGELWGSVTDVSWGVVFATGGPLPRHPTQLYEAFLEGLVLLAILYTLARRDPPLPRGSYFATFLMCYGVFRIGVEFVRQPDAQLGYLLGTDWVTMGMLLSVPMVIGGLVLLFYSLNRNAPQMGMELLDGGDDGDAEDTESDSEPDPEDAESENEPDPEESEPEATSEEGSEDKPDAEEPPSRRRTTTRGRRPAG